MLRAAYFGQELLSTFGTSIGEIALIPATGGIFTVNLTYKPEATAENSGDVSVQDVLIWDRKAEGGFPETKILKQRVRNHIEPGKDLGHSDKPSNKTKGEGEKMKQAEDPNAPGTVTGSGNDMLDSMALNAKSTGAKSAQNEDKPLKQAEDPSAPGTVTGSDNGLQDSLTLNAKSTECEDCQ